MKNSVRIIGGKWRGRNVYFSAKARVRPTLSRTRETLFNWLSPYIDGANCLDAYAGSGVLGFEAVSRGANSAILLDCSRQVVSKLRAQAQAFNASGQISVYLAHFPSQTPHFDLQAVDIIFLDPPFHGNKIDGCFNWLASTHCLAKHPLVYVEAEGRLDMQSKIPAGYELMRLKKGRQVQYALLGT